MPPCVVAFPDCFTKLGGNQYINSAAMGRWDDFLREEAVPFVEKTFGCGGAGRRGCFGKSSGGYGAMAHAMLHPDFWAAAASHSGDIGFELCYLPEFPRLLRALAKQEGSIAKWIDAFWAAPKQKETDWHDLMTLAMCATYDPDPEAPYGVRLPVTMDTCELIPERWRHFVSWDPLTLVETHGEGLKKLKAFYVDCGDIDQFNLVYGARRLHKRLEAMGVPHTYEEFRRRPHRGRLPDGREPADPGAGAERLIQRHGAGIGPTVPQCAARDARSGARRIGDRREGGTWPRGMGASSMPARRRTFRAASPTRLPTSSIARGGGSRPGSSTATRTLSTPATGRRNSSCGSRARATRRSRAPAAASSPPCARRARRRLTSSSRNRCRASTR